ncbi:MAG TPA: thermonuclease family protein [Glycomyces sp.]|nr:thermonuclease family protein [Glycomyces sp.]
MEIGMEGPGDFFATSEAYEVVDGDTFRAVIDGEKIRVRIMGINSPESGGYREEEDWGAEAKAYAKRKLEGRTVHLFTDPGDPIYDQYDRLLAHVVMENGMNYAVLAVAEGMAECYILRHQELVIGDTLRKAERLAKAEKRGMWATAALD